MKAVAGIARAKVVSAQLFDEFLVAVDGADSAVRKLDLPILKLGNWHHQLLTPITLVVDRRGFHRLSH